MWLYRKPAAHIADYDASLQLSPAPQTASGYEAELSVRVVVRTPPSWRRAEVMDGVWWEVPPGLDASKWV